MTLRRVLIAVEGPHDEAFTAKVARVRFGLKIVKLLSGVDAFWTPTIPRHFPSNQEGDILRRVSLPSFYAGDSVSLAIYRAGGDSGLVRSIRDTLDMLQAPPDAIGIVADADTCSADERHEALAADLLAMGLRAERMDYSAARPPTCGVYVLPDNQAEGTLETLLVAAASTSYPRALEAAQGYVAKAESLGFTEKELKEIQLAAGPAKAAVGAIAAILKPCRAIQNSLSDDRWVTVETLAQPAPRMFAEFLGALLGIPD